MNESATAMLDRMTTAEIAEAIDSRKYWRGLRHRILCIARSGAFTWFLFQYLLFFRINLLWIIAITAFVLVVELRTNRFTMPTYSTPEIVDLLMKRARLTSIKNEMFKWMAAGASIWVASVVACEAGAPPHACNAGLFFGSALLLCATKRADLIKNTYSNLFDHHQSDQGGFHVKVHRSSMSEFLVAREHPVLSRISLSVFLAGLMLAPLFAVVFFLLGGSDTLQEGQQVMFTVSILFSVFGCGVHEPARFHLVQGELDRLREKLA